MEEIMLTHPDTVSGTTVFADGIKVFWTEGYSDVVIVYPDGFVDKVDSMNRTNPVLARERAFEESKHACREMSRADLLNLFESLRANQTCSEKFFREKGKLFYEGSDGSKFELSISARWVGACAKPE